jgi:hypothetical protein
VYARYINPTADNFLGIMPGILAGLDADNDLVGMVSLGMLSVELEDDAGNALEIAGGKTVKVTMPAAIDAPATIPLGILMKPMGLGRSWRCHQNRRYLYF